MGLYENWIAQGHGNTDADKQVVNMEVLLKTLDRVLAAYGALNMAPPVGFHYIQFGSGTNGAFVAEDEPAQLFPNTSWTQMFSSDAVFFRTGGTLANENRATNGIQPDAIRNIRGQMQSANYNMAGLFDATASGAFVIGGGNGANNPPSILTGHGSDGYTGMQINANAGTTSANPMAGYANGSEIRPRNRLIKVWRRTA